MAADPRDSCSSSTLTDDLDEELFDTPSSTPKTKIALSQQRRKRGGGKSLASSRKTKNETSNMSDDINETDLSLKRGNDEISEDTAPMKEKISKSKKKVSEGVEIVQIPDYTMSDDFVDGEKSSFENNLSDQEFYHNFDPNDPKKGFEVIPFDVYCQFQENFESIGMAKTSSDSIVIVSPSIKLPFKPSKIIPIKSFGHHIIIFNYPRKDGNSPIVIMMNEKDRKTKDSETLQLYRIDNTYQPISSNERNIFMVIAAPKKKYAKIMFEKFIKFEKITFMNLKNVHNWSNALNPKKIK